MPAAANSSTPRASMSVVGLLALNLVADGALVRAASPPDRVLFGYVSSLEREIASIATRDAQVSRATHPQGPITRVLTGHHERWPGITLPIDASNQNLSAYGAILVGLKNSGTNRVTVYCRVDNPGADGVRHCVTGSVQLEPGADGSLRVPMPRTAEDRLGGKLFGMRGYPVRAGGDGAFDPARVNQILLFVSEPRADHQFDFGPVRATGTYTPPTAAVTDADPFFPFIDTFGQYRHRDWPGKVHSVAELASQRAAEARHLETDPGPKDWDRFGGWAAGPTLKATGFFRTAKVNGKWWLVDPDGHLFFSHGIDCVRMIDVTPVAERDAWFQDFPGTQPEFKEFQHPGFVLKGHYAGRSVQSFGFAAANLKRKYGPTWNQAYPEVIHRRLRAWGLNTIGMWSDEGVRLLRHTPYVDAVGSHGARMIEGSEGYWGKFPDVFDPAFAKSLDQQMAAKKGRSAGDPWCLGFFSDNEMSWGDELSLAQAALGSKPDQPAKQAFLADLRAKYTRIEDLNRAWGTQHASWEDFAQSTARPDPAKAGDDLRAFYTRIAEQYFRTVRDAIHSAAPGQIYLGCRFAWVNPRAAAAAARYCDVVSYNLYQRDVADFRFPGGTDVPLIIGEFHFGALDRGLFHTGLVPVENQAARAQAYRNYVLGARRHPQFVGCHWFQYQDEPTTGRVYDEENYQIGFVDIADTPYTETVTASREIGNALFNLTQ
jgi:hypothetical protein